MGIFNWIDDFRRLLRPVDDGLNHQEPTYAQSPNDNQEENFRFEEVDPAAWTSVEEEGFGSMFQQMEAMLKDMEGVFQVFPPNFGSMQTFEPGVTDQQHPAIERNSPRDQMLKPDARGADRVDEGQFKIPDFQFVPNSRKPDEDLDSRVAVDGIDAVLTPEQPRDFGSVFDWFGSRSWGMPSSQGDFALQKPDHDMWSSSSISTSRQHRHYPDGRVEERVVETRDGSRTERVTRRVGSASSQESVTVDADGKEHRKTAVTGTENNTPEEFEQLWSRPDMSEVNPSIYGSSSPRSLFDRIFPFRPKT